MQLLQDIKEEISKPNPFLIRTERINDVPPKKFSGNDHWSYFIRVFLDVDTRFKGRNPLTFDDIAFVKYHLHPSYKVSTRLSEDRVNKFEIKIWSYGYFRLFATIYPHIGDERILEGQVKFTVRDDEKQIE